MVKLADNEPTREQGASTASQVTNYIGLMYMQGWHRRRKFFNHQIWKNEFVLALESLNSETLLRRSEKGIEGIEDARLAWLKLRKDASAVFATYERDCSPRHFFKMAPLAPVDRETADWLPDFVHEDWLARKNVKSWVARGEAILGKIENAFAKCYRRALREPMGALGELIANCKELGDHLQNHPTRSGCV